MNNAPSTPYTTHLGQKSTPGSSSSSTASTPAKNASPPQNSSLSISPAATNSNNSSRFPATNASSSSSSSTRMENNDGGGRKNNHSRQASQTLSPTATTSVFPPASHATPSMRDIEATRGRRSSSVSSSASAARNSIYSISAPQPAAPAPLVKHTPPPHQPNTAEVFDQMEKEQEAIVNKLQREITELKHENSEQQQRSRSQSTSSSTSASVSRNASVRSGYSVSDAEELGKVGQTSTRMSRSSFSGYDDQALITSLRKENEQLKKKLADLSIKLTERDSELEQLRTTGH